MPSVYKVSTHRWQMLYAGANLLKKERELISILLWLMPDDFTCRKEDQLQLVNKELLTKQMWGRVKRCLQAGNILHQWLMKSCFK